MERNKDQVTRDTVHWAIKSSTKSLSPLIDLTLPSISSAAASEMLKATAEAELSSTLYTNGDTLCKGCICPIEPMKKMENKLSSFKKRLKELNSTFAWNSYANQTVEVMARENGKNAISSEHVIIQEIRKSEARMAQSLCNLERPMGEVVQEVLN